MAGLLAFLLLLALVALAVSLLACLIKKLRPRAKKFAGVALIVCIGAGFGFNYFLQREAALAGYESSTDLTAAKNAGAASPEEWQAMKARQAEEAVRLKAEQAEAEKRQAELAMRAEKEKELACRQDLSCWGEKAFVAASIYCPPQIERLAKYDFEWTDGFLGAKLSRHRWASKDAGTVTLIGDHIKFQNGFGAWQNHIYECDFDPELEMVLEVRAIPGRLPE